MRRLVALMLVGVMVFSFVGCTSGSNKPEQQQDTEKDDTEAADNADNTEAADNTDSAGDTQGDTAVAEKPEGYPSSTISFIVPAAAGAENDLVTRALNDNLDLGGNCVIENIPGASQSVGNAEVINRDADGQTLLTCANAGMLLMPLTADLTYDLNDFRHIAMMTAPITMVICTRAESDIKNAEDWLEYIKSSDSYLYSHTAGAGGLGQLAAADFLEQLGSTTGQFVAYEGSAELTTALLNGEIDWALLAEGDASVRVKSGEINAIYLISEEASESCQENLPGVPCLSEAGVENLSNYEGYKWVAIKKDTPEDVVEWIKKQLNLAIQSEGYQEWLVSAGYTTVREYSEEEITKYITEASDKYAEIMKNIGLSK